jgi:6-phosphofructokinase 2
VRDSGIKACHICVAGRSGDSFLAGITLGLAQGRDPEDAFALAVAAGTAAVMIAGTELCRRADVERLYCTIKERASRVAFERP